MAMIGLGLAPRPLVDSRLDASDEILRLRQERLSRQQKRQADVLPHEHRPEFRVAGLITGTRATRTGK
jgi:hypothetical protein